MIYLKIVKNIVQMHKTHFSLTRLMKWAWWRHQLNHVEQIAIFGFLQKPQMLIEDVIYLVKNGNSF